jgi:mRNA guanylyltransferase
MGGSVPVIPGEKADHHLAEEFRKEVASLLGRRNINFPGAQPVSFSSRHLDELRKRDYFVTEKSDGIRCLLYCAQNDGPPPEIHYLIDRKNDYYYVPNLHFPVPDDPEFQKFHTETIVDGELVMDKMKDGSEKMKYLVFDCLVLDGNSLLDRPLDKRLAYFREKMFLPYQSFCKKYPDYAGKEFPFLVEFKASQKSYGVEMLFREIIPQLRHGNDGLIFTCRETPYKFGTDEHILKWKPPSENSVDFRMQLEFPLQDPDSEDEEDGITSLYPDYAAMPTFNLFALENDRKHSHFGAMYMEEEEWERLKALNEPLDERIVECYQDSQHRWRFLRFREDKKDANHISTVQKVMESIRDGVSENDLMRNAKSIRDNWKRREAVLTDPKRRSDLEDARRQAEREREEAAKREQSRNGTPGAGVKRVADEMLGDGRRDSDKRLRTEPDGSERSISSAFRSGENGIPTPEGSVGADQATGSQPRLDEQRDGDIPSCGGSTLGERRTSQDEA